MRPSDRDPPDPGAPNRRTEEISIPVPIVTAGPIFTLSPEDGRAALPRLLQIARRHQMNIEVVALADTRDLQVDLDDHVAAIGRIIAAHGNGVLEIANEPGHATQAPDLQKDVLSRLRRRVAATVPVALGSVERGEGFAAGD